VVLQGRSAMSDTARNENRLEHQERSQGETQSSNTNTARNGLVDETTVGLGRKSGIDSSLDESSSDEEDCDELRKEKEREAKSMEGRLRRAQQRESITKQTNHSTTSSDSDDDDDNQLHQMEAADKERDQQVSGLRCYE
jgi:hypothetical protein